MLSREAGNRVSSAEFRRHPYNVQCRTIDCVKGPEEFSPIDRLVPSPSETIRLDSHDRNTRGKRREHRYYWINIGLISD